MEYIIKINDNDVVDADGGKRVEEMHELVRCKDCKHGEKVNSVYLCGKSRGFGIAHEPSWYCADGERKDGDGE